MELMFFYIAGEEDYSKHPDKYMIWCERVLMPWPKFKGGAWIKSDGSSSERVTRRGLPKEVTLHHKSERSEGASCVTVWTQERKAKV